MAPQRHLAENAADGVRLLSADQVRERVDRIAHRVEAAAALRTRHGVVSTSRLARRNDRDVGAPHELVQHRAEPHAVGGLAHRPGTPAHDRARELADDVSCLDHFAAIAA